ncbi:MAG TPA: hypothetical protein DIC19_03045 [Erysipelotrichaceae bacterium]|nr:hypothetical protein [Erysipelotrichaceae bacterium]
MKNNALFRFVLPAIIIMGGGFILFNVAFILFALVVNLTISIFGTDPHSAPPVLSRLLGFLAIGGLTWIGFKINLKSDEIKHTLRATLITMPLMALLIALGIMLYEQAQWMVLLAGALIIVPSLYYVWRLKLSWKYLFAIIYVAVLALYVMWSGMDI